MGLFEGESLPRSAKQIDRVGVNDQDDNIMKRDIDRRNTQKRFSVKKRLCLVVEEDGSRIEHRLK